MKQHDILQSELERLKEGPDILGVMLIGSFAGGYATEYSDLDIYVLCGRDGFENDWIDGVLVERTFSTPDSARKKIAEVPMAAYRWQGAKILHDPQGLLAGLAEEARQAYEAYTPTAEFKGYIARWLVSQELKLNAAIEGGDTLKTGYLVSTGAWATLEAMWAVNGRPMPPTGTAYRLFRALERVPCANWFEGLFEGAIEQRAAHMRSVIAWALPILRGQPLRGTSSDGPRPPAPSTRRSLGD